MAILAFTWICGKQALGVKLAQNCEVSDDDDDDAGTWPAQLCSSRVRTWSELRKVSISVNLI